MAHFEREQDGETQPVGDLAKVRAMLASGELKGTDRLRVDGGPWALAKELPQLRSLFAPTPDLWSAWDEEDFEDEDSESASEAHPSGQVSAPGTPGPSEPPPAVEPVSLDPLSLEPEPLEPEPLEPEALEPEPLEPEPLEPEPLEPEPLEPEPLESGSGQANGLEPVALPDHAVAPLPPPPVGKVLAFPGPKRAGHHSSAALRYETTPLLVHEGLEPLARVLKKTEEKLPGRFQTRHYWMLASILATCLLTMLMVIWVRGTAGWTSDAPLGQTVLQAELPELPGMVSEVEEPQTQEPSPKPELDDVVAELRGRISREATPLGADSSAMEDLLFVELRRVVALDRVQIKLVDSAAMDQPSSMELKLVLQEDAAQDLIRSFTAIGLVVGKYVDREGLDLLSMKVLVPRDTGTLERSFDGQRAAAFWRGDLEAQAYLRGE